MNFFKKVGAYCLDSYNELIYKVTWPSRSELTSSAIVVMIASIIIALVIFAVDFAFEFVMNLVYSFIS